MPASKPCCVVRKLTGPQMEQLKRHLTGSGWEMSDAEYCVFKAKKEKTSAAGYTSGKLVVQGAGAGDFIEFILEPYITGAALPGTAAETPEEPFTPHAGIDESGKGDFFGPLVIACAYVGEADTGKELEKIGVMDSKLIKNDAVITRLAGQIRVLLRGKIGLVAVGPEAYNRAYLKIGNLNSLLAWGHARALENLLDRAPECSRALSDQFADARLIPRALMEKGKHVRLEQHPKAESDIAVAAASILARAEFVRRLGLLEKDCGLKLPKGAGPQVDDTAAEIAGRGGSDALRKVAKMHFRNAYRALGLAEPEKKEWRRSNR